MTVPTQKLSSNAAIPLVGFGTYLIPDDEAASVVATALDVGYRHVDTAEAYGNEAGVGQAVRGFVESGRAKRADVFVTTKVFPGNAAWGMPAKTYDQTIAACNASLGRLGLDHVDLYLIHAPFNAAERLDQWRALVELQKQGKTRAIGVSNYSEAHIEEIRQAGLPLPDANQIELHPWSQKPELVAYLVKNAIVPIAYSSLVPLSSWRAVEGQDSAKTEQMVADGGDDSPFRAMAARYGVTEAQILLRWAVQKGYPVLPKSMKAERIRQNFDLLSFELNGDDMAAIAKMDRGGGVAWRTGDPVRSE